MKKYALKITETYTRTVVVEVEDEQDYLTAEDKCAEAYYAGTITLNADNSAVDVEIENDTENYLEIFGKEEFEKMDSEL